MPVNSSSKEKTVKEMYKILPNDSWIIDKFDYYANYDNKCVVAVKSILDNYNDYFSQYLEEAEVPERFYYQPAAFSENYYGTPDLDFLVLYFARMTSLFDFKQAKITVLPKTKLTELNKLIVKYKSDIEDSIVNPTDYIKDPDVGVSKKYYY